MANRLAKESSPYLSQHQDNPVDWYPWGEEAFARAKREDKPIFLSIGYSSCHWCHVMEHESFESEEIAAILNESFVSIKVDREERPDVDEAYMTAVQIGSGRGGWPISAFLTPDGDPFFAGAYFPPENRGDHPGFKTVLEQIRQLWAADRPKVQGFADEYAQALRQSLTQSLNAADVVLGADLLDACVQAHTLEFDEESGGFGPAPKFPPHSAIEFLLTYALIEEAPEELRQAAADMALTTLHQMAMSGLQDVVGGGFHRYSTDPHWHLPHFEKMLYDNALLLGNYARAAAMCHGQMPELEKVFDRVCNKIVGWLKREMTSPEGIFYSAVDADSDGEEGKFYVWTHDEISRLLGEDSASFLNAFQVHKEGNFHDEASGVLTGQNVLHPVEVLGDRFDQELRMLLEAREHRVRPSLDDKALIGWNGLAIGALSEAGEIEMAERAAEAILKAEGEFGSLPRQVVRGVPKGEAYLEDYACLADGLISLAHAKSLFEEHVGANTAGRSARAWLGEAHRLADVMVTRFYDSSVGGFFATSDRHEVLFGRTKPVFDQPIPSANAVAVRVLIEIGDDSRARACLEHFKGWMAKAPQATEALHLALLGLPGESVPESEVRVEVSHKKVVVELTSTNLQADQTGIAHGSVLISIPEGHHLNSPNPPARWLTPTAIQFEPPIGMATYPKATDDRYLGNVLIPFEIQLPRGESGADIQLKVSYQACTDSECQLPEEIKFNLVVQRIT